MLAINTVGVCRIGLRGRSELFHLLECIAAEVDGSQLAGYTVPMSGRPDKGHPSSLSRNLRTFEPHCIHGYPEPVVNGNNYKPEPIVLE